MKTNLNKKIHFKIVELFNKRIIYEKVGDNFKRVTAGSVIVSEISKIFYSLLKDNIIQNTSSLSLEPYVDKEIKESNKVNIAYLNKKYKLNPLKEIGEANGIKFETINEVWSNSPFLDDANVKTIDQLIEVINLITKINPIIDSKVKKLSNGKYAKLTTIKYISKTRAIIIKFIKGYKNVDIYFVGNFKSGDIVGLELDKIGSFKKRVKNRYEVRSLELPSTLKDSTLRLVVKEFLKIKSIF